MDPVVPVLIGSAGTVIAATVGGVYSVVMGRSASRTSAEQQRLATEFQTLREIAAGRLEDNAALKADIVLLRADVTGCHERMNVLTAAHARCEERLDKAEEGRTEQLALNAHLVARLTELSERDL